MVPRDLLVLFLNHRARLDPRFVGADLLLDSSLFLPCGDHGLLGCAKLSFQLLKLWCVSTFGGGRSWCRFSRDARYLRLQIGNLARDRDHVGILRRVECLQLLLFCDESLELLSALIHRNAGGRLRALQVMSLLRDQSFQKRRTLLHPIQRLSRSVKLGCERLKRACIRRCLFGELADIFTLEFRQLCVLLVKASLRVGELLLQEVGRTFSRLLTRAQVFAYEQRGDLATHLLSRARIMSLEGDEEPRHSAGPAGLIRSDRGDGDGLPRQIDPVVHGIVGPGKQVKTLDDRFDARTAQDLFLHRRQPLAQIFIDDRLHVVFRNLLLLDDHQRLRHVLRSHDESDAYANPQEQNPRSQNQPESPSKDTGVVFYSQFTVPEHTAP